MVASVTRPKATTRREGKPADSEPVAPVPELPPWKAFVVQFSRKADVPAGIFSGRVEHLNSGRRTSFQSSAELVRILETMLEGIAANEK